MSESSTPPKSAPAPAPQTKDAPQPKPVNDKLARFMERMDKELDR